MYEHEYEYTNFKSIQIRMLFQKVFKYIYKYIMTSFLFEYRNFKFIFIYLLYLLPKYRLTLGIDKTEITVDKDNK